MNVDELTTQFLASIQSKVSTAVYGVFFKNIHILDVDQSTVMLYIDSDFKKKKIIDNADYTNIIEQTLKEITGKDYTFEMVTDTITNELVNANQVEEEPKQTITASTPISISTIEEENIRRENKKINNNLNPDLRFDNYVIGDANKAAHIVALEVAKNPGKTYNPFFLYGRSGTGKTHLMHAIGNYIVEHSDQTVLYIRSEQFINDFIDMTRKTENSDNLTLIESFKDKYQNVDVLIIDDIQMMRDATKSKEQLFNTMDTLFNLKKQIIISSDTSPNDLDMFEARLKTRFYQGITIDIKPPDKELKVKILKNKLIGTTASELVSDEVLEYIANNSPSDVRSLEGAINRLLLMILMYPDKEINIEFINDVLNEVFGSNQYMTNDLARIRKTVADYYDVTEESLKSKKRQASINKARQVAMYISSIQTDETVERIGQHYNRDHATVLHGCEKIKEELQSNSELEKEIKEIRDLLTE